MLNENQVFTIEASIAHSEIEKVHKDIVENIDKIKTIEIKQEEALKSSALLSLLVSIKNFKPEISIPLIEKKDGFLNGLGTFSIVK